MKRKQKLIIGRSDVADFPDLKLSGVEVKVDTGAYTSSIHCHHIEERVKGDRNTISFSLLDPSHPQYNNKRFTTTNYSEKRIRNSFGQSEKRYIIRTNILLFGITYPLELSLSERGDMRFPVLLGRKLLKGKFIVDASKYNLSHRNKKSIIKILKANK